MPLQPNNTSPIAVPNLCWQSLGWNVDAVGVFYIRQLALSSSFDALHLCRLRHPSSSKLVVQEVQSDVIDHSEWGTFKDFKLEEDLYPYHYYHAVFDVYVLPLSVTEGPNSDRTGLDKAINSCIQPDLGCSHGYFAPDLDKFPNGAK